MHTSARKETFRPWPRTTDQLLRGPPERDEEFLSRWQEINAHMAAQPGYLGHRLHRSLSPDAHLSAARDERYEVLRAAFASSGFTSTPSLYEVVYERQHRDDQPADNSLR